MLSEFDLIDGYFANLAKLGSAEIGVGDDGAVTNISEQYIHPQLVSVTDTLIEGVHFPIGTDPYSIGWKSLAVNLSDLAAMGAKPDFYSLALTLPKNQPLNPDWFAAFSHALKDLNQQFSIRLIGGDTTRGDTLTITISAHGWVESGKAVLRSGAQVGDLICVTGEIGLGGLGLAMVLEQGLKVDHRSIDKLNRPVPRVKVALAVSDQLNSMIDVSDGLLSDIEHVMKASGTRAVLDYSCMPIGEEVQSWVTEQQKDILWPISCGDDFELCFTLSSSKLEQVKQIVERENLSLSVIGEVASVSADRPDDRVSLWSDGEELPLPFRKGYQHF